MLIDELNLIIGKFNLTIGKFNLRDLPRAARSHAAHAELHTARHMAAAGMVPPTDDSDKVRSFQEDGPMARGKGEYSRRTDQSHEGRGGTRPCTISAVSRGPLRLARGADEVVDGGPRHG